MVELNAGVVKLLPVKSGVPPLEAAYQRMVPALGTALKVTVLPLHPSLLVTPFMVGMLYTKAATAVREAEVQPLLCTSA